MLRLAFVLVVLFTSTSYASNCKTLIYSMNPHYPPYSWEENGKFKGATEDLMQLLSKNLDIKVQSVSYPWLRAITMAKNGEIDLVASLYINSERKEFLKFTSKPILPNPAAVFVRKSQPIPFSEWSDLKKYTGVFSLGDAVDEEFDKYRNKHLNYTLAESMEAAFLMLEKKRADYFITGRNVGRYYLKKNNKEGVIVPLKPNIGESGLYMGFSKKSKCFHLYDRFDKELSRLHSSGDIERVFKKYVSELDKGNTD